MTGSEIGSFGEMGRFARRDSSSRSFGKPRGSSAARRSSTRRSNQKTKKHPEVAAGSRPRASTRSPRSLWDPGAAHDELLDSRNTVHQLKNCRHLKRTGRVKDSKKKGRVVWWHEKESSETLHLLGKHMPFLDF